MLKRAVDRVRGSLTVRIFLITALILFAACGVTYLFIAWATPITYRSIETENMSEKVDVLVSKLQDVTPAESNPLLKAFYYETGAEVALVGPDGTVILPDYKTEDVDEATTIKPAEASPEIDSEVSYSVTAGSDVIGSSIFSSANVAVTVSDWNLPVAFKGSDAVYELSVIANVTAVNQAVQAMGQVLPYLILVVLVISILGALFYSRYITRPIVRLSGISRKMADMDFDWKCGETRADELGQLGRSLDELSERLSAAMTDLKTANDALRQDIDRERALEQQRMTFFSAASHELKTPITILKGQLAGMLAGVDVYQDRDKYLSKSLTVTNRMEALVQEILDVSRMERADFVIKDEVVNLSALVRAQTELLAELAEQRGQDLETEIAKKVQIRGDRALLERAVSNLLSNASLHAPEGARIAVKLRQDTVLTVENTGVRIPEEAIPHLFEAFYRTDASRSRATGGSGLGLYLVKMILDRHGATCKIENMLDGVCTTVYFS